MELSEAKLKKREAKLRVKNKKLIIFLREASLRVFSSASLSSLLSKIHQI